MGIALWSRQRQVFHRFDGVREQSLDPPAAVGLVQYERGTKLQATVQQRGREFVGLALTVPLGV